MIWNNPVLLSFDPKTSRKRKGGGESGGESAGRHWVRVRLNAHSCPANLHNGLIIICKEPARGALECDIQLYWRIKKKKKKKTLLFLHTGQSVTFQMPRDDFGAGGIRSTLPGIFTFNPARNICIFSTSNQYSTTNIWNNPSPPYRRVLDITLWFINSERGMWPLNITFFWNIRWNFGAL